MNGTPTDSAACHKRCCLLFEKLLPRVTWLSLTSAARIESFPTECAVATPVSLQIVVGSADKFSTQIGTTVLSVVSTTDVATRMYGL